MAASNGDALQPVVTLSHERVQLYDRGGVSSETRTRCHVRKTWTVLSLSGVASLLPRSNGGVPTPRHSGGVQN